MVIKKNNLIFSKKKFLNYEYYTYEFERIFLKKDQYILYLYILYCYIYF